MGLREAEHSVEEGGNLRIREVRDDTGDWQTAGRGSDSKGGSPSQGKQGVLWQGAEQWGSVRDCSAGGSKM